MMASLLLSCLIGFSVSVDVKLDGRGLAKQTVEGVGFNAGQDVFHDTKQTDASGRAQFNLPSGDINFMFRAVYDGIPYLSEFLYSKQIPKSPLVIQAFHSSDSNDQVFIKDLRISLTPEREDVLVDEEIIISNPTTTTLKARPSGESFRITLPFGTHDLKFVSGFEEPETKFEGNDIVSAKFFLPGTTRFSMKYAVEKGFWSAELLRKFSMPIRQISLGAPPETRFSGLNLVRGADKFFGGSMFRTYTASIEGKKSEVKLGLGNLPIKYRATQVIPFAVFFLLLIVFVPLSRRVLPKDSTENKKAILEKLLLLMRMKEKALIDESEFQIKRFQLLERLAPFYED
jgi:hypothetical protein